MEHKQILFYNTRLFVSIFKEPVKILIPTRASCVSNQIGPCTTIQSVSNYKLCHLVSGHLNGYILLWSLCQFRVVHQWSGHPDTQVTGLHSWSRIPNSPPVLVSHGRDGFIRFWDLSSLDFKTFKLNQPLGQVLSEIATSTVTFCTSSIWSSILITNKSPNSYYYLAYLVDGSQDDPNHTLGSVIEIIQLPQSTIIYNYEIECIQKSKQIQSNLGMCMTLQGIESPIGCPKSKSNPQCILLAGFESGHLVLFVDGHLVCVLDHCLGPSRPIISSAIRPTLSNETMFWHTRLIAIGGPEVNDDTCLSSSSSSSSSSFAFIQLEYQNESTFKLKLINMKSCRTKFSSGILCLRWRSDGKLIALGQWNGQISLIQTNCTRTSKDESRSPVCVSPCLSDDCKYYKFKYLGCLISLGALDEGSLLGDWNSITFSKPHGPNIDQKSKLIRSIVFDQADNYLITSVPAIGGSNGSLLMWDVYRT